MPTFNNADSVRIGMVEVDRVMLGGTEVWSAVIPITFFYADTQFTVGSNNEVLSPTVQPGAGPISFSLSGSLPSGVTFDGETGTFTGPPSSAWNFTATSVGSNYRHSCAVTTGGGVKCWGYNAQGQLGNGTYTDSTTPVDVSGLTSGVVSISVGADHTCVVTTSGGVKCWGLGTRGRLGDGTTTTRNTPVDVSGLTSGVSSVSAGGKHTCAVTTGGGVKCWGYGVYGRLGDGTTTQRNTPVNVSGLTSGVSSVSAGADHTCVVTTSGGVKCWGYNLYGRLGDGTTTQRNTPVDVSGLTSGVSSVSSGNRHTCAVTTGGGVKCWGYNFYGALGNGASGSTGTSSVPVDVSGLTSGVSSVSAAFYSTCARTTSGGVKCWGYNAQATLGNGTLTKSTTPVDVSGLTSGVSFVSGTDYSVCAVTTSGTVKCWGYNAFGQLGDGTTTRSTTPVNVIAAPAGFPSTVTVTVTDDSGSDTQIVTLTYA